MAVAWYTEGEEPVLEGVEGRLVLPAGTWNITLIVRDGHQGEDRAVVLVVVEEVPPPTTSGNEDGFPWYLLLLLLIVVLSVAVVLHTRMRMDEAG
jgi:hypothetical protein